MCKTASCVNSRKYWVCTVPIYGLLCFSTLPVGYDDRKVKVEKTENSIVCIFMIPRPNQSPQYQLSACWRTFYLNRKFRMKYVFFCGVVIGVLGACLLVYMSITIDTAYDCLGDHVHYLHDSRVKLELFFAHFFFIPITVFLTCP